jgi:hypothetical protein
VEFQIEIEPTAPKGYYYNAMDGMVHAGAIRDECSDALVNETQLIINTLYIASSNTHE